MNVVIDGTIRHIVEENNYVSPSLQHIDHASLEITKGYPQPTPSSGEC